MALQLCQPQSRRESSQEREGSPAPPAATPFSTPAIPRPEAAAAGRGSSNSPSGRTLCRAGNRSRGARAVARAGGRSTRLTVHFCSGLGAAGGRAPFGRGSAESRRGRGRRGAGDRMGGPATEARTPDFDKWGRADSELDPTPAAGRAGVWVRLAGGRHTPRQAGGVDSGADSRPATAGGRGGGRAVRTFEPAGKRVGAGSAPPRTHPGRQVAGAHPQAHGALLVLQQR